MQIQDTNQVISEYGDALKEAQSHQKHKISKDDKTDEMHCSLWSGTPLNLSSCNTSPVRIGH